MNSFERIACRGGTVMAASVLMLGLVAANPPGASAAPSCVSVGSSFDTVLKPGQCIESPNRRFVAVMQLDGNFVLYPASRGAACWASSGTDSEPMAGDHVIFQTVRLPGRTEYGLAVGHPAWGLFFPATYRFDGGDTHVGDGVYNVSVNDQGALWAGYDKIGSC